MGITKHLLTPLVLALAVGSFSLSSGAGAQPASSADAAAFKQFDAAIANYMAMRTKLSSEVARILGKYLVLRDVDPSLIIDYIPVAVPR